MQQTKTGRRLLFFLDGTGDNAARKASNVFRLNRAFTNGFFRTPQIVFYFAGVGTRGDWTSLATGRGFDQIVVEAFLNLASNYMEGDTIYLFGFSRGAAAVRALSGLLAGPGLLSVERMVEFPDAWKYFVAPRLSKEEQKRILEKLSQIRFNPQPTIRFLGCFDTVPGSSWDRLRLFTKIRFPTLALDQSVEAAVQILALDDNRNPSFTPLLWQTTSSPNQKLEQIWMPGVHADIGGTSDGSFLSNIALLTMVNRVKHYCPELEWDKPFLGSLVKQLLESPVVEITSERPGFFRKLLHRRIRRVGTQECQYLHPVFACLRGKTFLSKGRRQTYEPINYPALLPILQTSYNRLFDLACMRLFHQ